MKLEVVDEPGGDRLARGDGLDFDVCERSGMPPAQSLTELANRVGVAEAAAAAVVGPPTMCEGLIGRGHKCSGVRSAIRLWLGFRRATEADATHLLAWLRREILPQDLDEAHVQESALASYRERQIEAPTSVSLRRFIWSALRAREADFFAATLAQLSMTTLEAMEALLTPCPTSATGEPAAERSELETAPFNDLKADPRPVGVASVLKEIAKLHGAVAVHLTDALFAGVTPKVLATYRLRTATEPASELQRHPAPICCTLVAAFCWQRC